MLSSQDFSRLTLLVLDHAPLARPKPHWERVQRLPQPELEMRAHCTNHYTTATSLYDIFYFYLAKEVAITKQ